ncbi:MULTISPECIES: hypothetical protein [unclassified Agrococcus]|uniref:hypothetical protein n=1 Tax=unclassified Agrococcus TaxID=2615065 RepID=UPI0036133AED
MADAAAHPARPMRARRLARRALVLGAGLLAATVTLGGVQPTEAAWSDAEHARTTVAAVTLAPPVVSSCAYSGALAAWTATFSLSGLTPGTTVRYRIYQPGTTTLAASGSVAVTGATLAVPLAGGQLLGRWPVEFDVVRGGWASTPAPAHVVTVLGLLGSCGAGA